MKKVFSSHSEVAHVFAQRSQSEGSAGNIYFYNDTIYSYGSHFPVARFIEVNGQTKVLFNANEYSVSTSKHKSIISSALSHYDFIYTYDMNNVKGNLKEITSIIKWNIAKLARARKPQIYIDNIMGEISTLETYLSAFPKTKVYKKDYPEIYDLRKKGLLYFDASLMEKVKVQAAKEKKAKEAKQAKLEKDNAQKVQDWKNFVKGASIPWNTGNIAYLRYNPTNDLVQTSKGINLTPDDAKYLFVIWKNNPSKLVGQLIQGHYKVNKCSKDFLIAGCHTIKFSEAEKIAQILNF